MTMVPDFVKRIVRLIEASVTPRTYSVEFQGATITGVNSLWWSSTPQSIASEIFPCFEPLVDQRDFVSILDAGAAEGLFSIAACLLFPKASIYASEPSLRQRILLRRNLMRNGVRHRVSIYKTAFWNSEGLMSFRSHGPLSRLREASGLPCDLPFSERVRTVTIDQCTAAQNLRELNLIKMDIEAAEIEALHGAAETLMRLRPRLLIQAYHIRNDVRTFEPCASFLAAIGYSCREASPGSGLLYATYDH
jgi:FkbM family methyltransferase